MNEPEREIKGASGLSSSGGSSPAVTVLLPSLNESSSIAWCVGEAQQGLAGAGLNGEVLVVDNGSTDGSAELAVRAGARVVVEEQRGYGNALRRGITEAKGAVTVMADADRTYDLSRLGELVAPLVEGSADVVLGSRLEGLNRGTMPVLHRLVGTPLISFALRRACPGLRVRDSQTGYRAFRTQQIRSLQLRAGGMEFASEMLIRSSQQGLRIDEKPLGYRPRAGRSKLDTVSDGWRHLQLILLLAPQLLLFWPGLVILTLGLALSALSLIYPVGFELGALHWQPIFLAPIMIVLGAMGALSGAAIAHHSTLAGRKAASRFAALGHPRFAGACITVGALAAVGGLLLELVLFAVWITDGSSPARALALAGIAQALVITGLALVGFGVLYRILVGQTAYRNHRAPGTVPPTEAEAGSPTQEDGGSEPETEPD